MKNINFATIWVTFLLCLVLGCIVHPEREPNYVEDFGQEARDRCDAVCAAADSTATRLRVRISENGYMSATCVCEVEYVDPE